LIGLASIGPFLQSSELFDAAFPRPLPRPSPQNVAFGNRPIRPAGWTQEGKKLVSTRSARQGTSVALSADGNIAIVGGFVEDGAGGAGA
jgi:hypothetical protein